MSTILGFDFGLKRIGVAVGNSILKQAQPLTIITAATNDDKFSAIAKLVADWEPDLAIVGLPLHPDGAEHEMTSGTWLDPFILTVIGKEAKKMYVHEVITDYVRDVMTHHVKIASPEDTLKHAAQMMEEHKISQIPVVDNGALVGALNTHDLFRAKVI